MATWEQLGNIATVAQLTGLDATKLIGMIVKSASAARMHKRSCRQFAHHLRMIGNLLEQLRISELKEYPETREPLEGLEDALRRSYILVNSCQDRSYLYLLAMGWNIVNHFKRAQNEIDGYLKLVPLMTLVDSARVRERLESIERHHCEYTLDEEDKKVQDVILNTNSYEDQAVVLKKSLSYSYPNLPFNEALQKENEKLKLELQRTQTEMDTFQREVVQRLIAVTETVASSLTEENAKFRNSKKEEPSYLDSTNDKGLPSDGYARDHNDKYPSLRNAPPVSSGHDSSSARESQRNDEWHSDLLGCCSQPCLCLKTFLCPCGTFSKIATVAKNRHISSAEACCKLLACSLVLSCCCYTCCVRRKLRKILNIRGGLCNDFLTHLLCCCCALVQEWREVKIRGVYGPKKTQRSPPPLQYMES